MLHFLKVFKDKKLNSQLPQLSLRSQQERKHDQLLKKLESDLGSSLSLGTTAPHCDNASASK